MTTSVFLKKSIVAATIGIATLSYAQQFDYNGISYKTINENSVETYRNNALSLKGDVIIPSQVEHNGKVYTVTKIGNDTFYNYKEITSITLPETITEIGHQSFMYCESLKTVNFPKSISKIGNSAFRFCKSLKEIVIPEQVTELNQNTFSDCTSLEKITFPKMFLKIGYWTFGQLYSLKEMRLEVSTPPILENTAFSNTPKDGVNEGKKDVIVKVPVGTKSAYEATDWKHFTIIEEGTTLSTAEREKNVSSIKLYPNPTTGMFFINSITDGKAEIHTITGQVVKVLSIKKGKNEVNITSLSTGTYYIKIGNNTFKVIRM